MTQKPRSHITLVPFGGLGNRLKAISAGIRLARQTHSDIDIYWVVDSGLACRFDQLFLPIDTGGVRLIEATADDLKRWDRPRRKNLYRPYLYMFSHGVRMFANVQSQDEIDRCFADGKTHNVWISSCVYFPDKDHMPVDAYDIFHPKAEIQAEIDRIARDFGDNTVGVHVRRTDNAGSIQGSKTEDFLECMELQQADTRFYLATDEEEIKTLMRGEFGDRIISMDAEACRSTADGIRNAVVEMYVLSRTCRIFGSHRSTFSAASACIGRIPYEATDASTADKLEPSAPVATKILTIIVSYNFMPWIDRCLGSLIHSQTPTDIMVIDNYSKDETVAEIERRYPQVMLVRNSENLGFGRANNIGMCYAIDHGYDAVLLLNQDAWIDANALGRLAEASRRHPRYGILSPIHLTGSGDKIEHGFAVYSGVQSKDSQPEAPLVQVPFIDAAIWYMPVAALKRVGLFAPIYKHYGEDKDLANRMAYHHYRIGFLPRVYGSHAREERKVTHDAFIHSEFVYHLSQETNPNEKYKHIHRINHLALWKKELMAIITLQWWRLGRFVRIWRQLKDLQGEIEKTRSESCNVDINNYR